MAFTRSPPQSSPSTWSLAYVLMAMGSLGWARTLPATFSATANLNELLCYSRPASTCSSSSSSFLPAPHFPAPSHHHLLATARTGPSPTQWTAPPPPSSPWSPTHYHRGLRPVTTNTRLYARGRPSSRDGPRGRRPPPAYIDSSEGGWNLNTWTKRIVALNVVTFILQRLFPQLTSMGVKSDVLIRRGQYYRLLTPVLLHADVYHLMANSYTTLNIGHAIEGTWGTASYLFLYLISGVCGNWMSYASGSAPLALGASTAVSGLLGGLTFWCWRHRNLYRVESLQSQLMQVVMINAFMGMTNPRIDNFGHLGGLLGGVACSFLFGPRQVIVTNSYGQRFIDNRPLIQTFAQSLLNGFKPLGPPPPSRRPRRPGSPWYRFRSSLAKGWASLTGTGTEKTSKPFIQPPRSWW